MANYFEWSDSFYGDQPPKGRYECQNEFLQNQRSFGYAQSVRSTEKVL